MRLPPRNVQVALLALLSAGTERWAKEDYFHALQPDGILLDWSLSPIFISNFSLLEWDHLSHARPTLLVFWKHLSCLILQVHSWRGIVNQEIQYLRSHLHLIYMKFRQGFQLGTDAGMGKICGGCWDRSSVWQNVMNWIVLPQNSHVEAPTPHLEIGPLRRQLRLNVILERMKFFHLHQHGWTWKVWCSVK